ncbi:MAG: SprT family zinc-dependent metalloprotease [Alphaproteobacteria bacterium]
MKRPVENYVVELNNGSVDLTILRNPRARRMTLRVDPTPGAATLVAPPFLDTRTAMRFVRENADWLSEKLSQQSIPVPFTHGAEIPIRGKMHRIEGLRTVRGLIERRNQTIFVPGGRDHLARRLTEWLKEEARAELTAAATAHARALGGKLSRITVRDQKSRWGSCSPDGNISFSWRLILAPSVILDYVAAHEAAHLVQMNHGPSFWKLVARRVKDTNAATEWLRLNGPELHRYGMAL